MQIVDDLQMKKIGAPSFPSFILTVCMLQTEIVNAWKELLKNALYCNLNELERDLGVINHRNSTFNV